MTRFAPHKHQLDDGLPGHLPHAGEQAGTTGLHEQDDPCGHTEATDTNCLHHAVAWRRCDGAIARCVRNTCAGREGTNAARHRDHDGAR